MTLFLPDRMGVNFILGKKKKETVLSSLDNKASVTQTLEVKT